MSHSTTEDLSSFLVEECRLFVLLARAARVGVILRRGPTRWWRASLWNMRSDQIEGGQWFHGKIYPEKCDLSPSGELLLYFGGKFRARDMDSGYGITHTVVSRPPYFTALALWPNCGTYGGGGVFLDDQTVVLYQSTSHHRDHPPGPLKVIGYNALDPRHHAEPSSRNGWSGVLTPPQTKRFSAWRKSIDGLTLERTVCGDDYSAIYPERQGAQYRLYRSSDEPLASFVAHWADFDSEGGLVTAVGGRVFRGNLSRKRGPLRWSETASLASEQFAPLTPPGWAQAWKPQRTHPRRG